MDPNWIVMSHPIYPLRKREKPTYADSFLPVLTFSLFDPLTKIIASQFFRKNGPFREKNSGFEKLEKKVKDARKEKNYKKKK